MGIKKPSKFHENSEGFLFTHYFSLIHFLFIYPN